MYYYPGKRLTYVRVFNKAAKLRYLDLQMTLPGLEEKQSQQIGGQKAVESASNLDFFGLLSEPVFLRALVLAARMTPVYRNLGS